MCDGLVLVLGLLGFGVLVIGARKFVDQYSLMKHQIANSKAAYEEKNKAKVIPIETAKKDPADEIFDDVGLSNTIQMMKKDLDKDA